MTAAAVAEIGAVLRRTPVVSVVSHYNPDADAYGSSCALTLALRRLGRTATCINESGILPGYRFLPGVPDVVTSFPSDRELLVVVDCGDRHRIGESLKGELSSFKTVINIDHHASNDSFGTLNYVVPTASSTAELIVDVLEALGGGIAADEATCLFAGLCTDTGSFRYSSTTARTFGTARRLVEAGASPHRIAQSLFSNDSLALVRLHAEALCGLELIAGGRAAIVRVTTEMFARHGAVPEDADGIVERARDVRGVEIAVLLKEDAGVWRVSMRSKDPRFDVAAVAAKFGGGGHRAAAGFRWRRPVGELEALLPGEIAAALAAGDACAA